MNETMISNGYSLSVMCTMTVSYEKNTTPARVKREARATILTLTASMSAVADTLA